MLTASLTTDAFLHSVRAAAPAIAVFDFDGTLWPGDAGSGFMDWSIANGLLTPDRAAWLHDRHALYRAGAVDEITICGEMVQVYRGIPLAAMESAAAQYFREHVEPHLFPAMVEIVRELQHQGSEVWAVSSTGNIIIEAAVRSLGIDPPRVLAACVNVADGVLTDELIDIPSDHKKAEALQRRQVKPDAVFGNSVHDLAMLELAQFPYAINPNPDLLAIAQQRGWPVFLPGAKQS